MNSSTALVDGYVADTRKISPVNSEVRFASTGVRGGALALLVDGDFTVRDINKPVTLNVKVGGFADAPVESVPVHGLSAMTTLRRTDSGFAAKVPALIVAEAVTVHLDIHATTRAL